MFKIDKNKPYYIFTVDISDQNVLHVNEVGPFKTKEKAIEKAMKLYKEEGVSLRVLRYEGFISPLETRVEFNCNLDVSIKGERE